MARRRFHLALWFFGCGLLCTASGCLSLGGRTTYVQSSPEIEARLSGLETRVGALEQALSTLSPSSLPIETDAGIPIQSEAPRRAKRQGVEQTDWSADEQP